MSLPCGLFDQLAFYQLIKPPTKDFFCERQIQPQRSPSSTSSQEWQPKGYFTQILLPLSLSQIPWKRPEIEDGVMCQVCQLKTGNRTSLAGGCHFKVSILVWWKYCFFPRGKGGRGVFLQHPFKRKRSQEKHTQPFLILAQLQQNLIKHVLNLKHVFKKVPLKSVDRINAEQG